MSPFFPFFEGRLLSLLPLILVGCATSSVDGGFSPVEQAAHQYLHKDVIWQRSDVDKTAVQKRLNELLRSPLTADDAVQIALLNNRGLQATFFKLGISESDVVQAGRLPNPGFSFSRTHQGKEVEIDRSIVVSIGRLLMMPTTLQIEKSRFEQTKREVTGSMLSLAYQTRKAYYNAVAAAQTVSYMQQVKQAAEAGAELAKRLLEAGNFDKLQQAREQNFYAESRLNLARAEQMKIRSYEKLTRLLGLTDSIYTLPLRLPDLPKMLEERTDIEQLAMSQRLDVQQNVSGTKQLAKNLELSKMARFVNVLEMGAIHKSSSDKSAENGYEVSLELPLFDWGGAKLNKGRSIYMQAVNQAEEVAVNARSEVREAYANYRTNFDIAKHYQDEIVPLQKQVSQENLLRYNGMLIGVFDLLADTRSQIASVNSAIEASRDFWIAKADFELSLIGQPAKSTSDDDNE
ncbi:MAG: putative copper resistance-related lipoprotein [Solimicrobium sp.]|nr:putative copper resistance-related lipoprotein [Solimicrobium sp.]